MNLKYNYWFFKSALSHKFCDDVIKHSSLKEEQLAAVGKLNVNKLSRKEVKDLKKTRNSNITWLNDQWIYNQIHPYIHMANKNAGWNFEWDWSESCQFTKYKLNQFYDWHCDSFEEPYNNPEDLNYHNKIRKLSVTCQLTDGSEYKGGELEFCTINKENKSNIKTRTYKCTEILSKGSIVVFPSHVWHRVKPVTKGKRYSLVMWNLGYPFK